MPDPVDDWFACPVCGHEVRANALACPGCGSDDETGWSDGSVYGDIDLPDEVLGDPAERTKQRSPGYTCVAVGLVIVILVVWVLAGP